MLGSSGRTHHGFTRARVIPGPPCACARAPPCCYSRAAGLQGCSCIWPLLLLRLPRGADPAPPGRLPPPDDPPAAWRHCGLLWRRAQPLLLLLGLEQLGLAEGLLPPNELVPVQVVRDVKVRVTSKDGCF